MNGYTGYGLDDFDKKGEWKEKFRFQAGAFFKSVKFQKDLIQPIRDCINLVHEDYMKTLQLMDWRLDALLLLNNQDFTDEIETLPLHFGVAQWNLLYNDGMSGTEIQRKNVR